MQDHRDRFKLSGTNLLLNLYKSIRILRKVLKINGCKLHISQILRGVIAPVHPYNGDPLMLLFRRQNAYLTNFKHKLFSFEV